MYLTDAQRDALGAETKSTVRSTLSLITRLEPAEKICVQAAVRVFRKKHSSLLKSVWAVTTAKVPRQRGEVAIKMLAVHREGMIWFLKNRLERASEEQREEQRER